MVCRGGHTPDLEVLLFLDPHLQFHLITQGLLRIYSQMDTATLIKAMRVANVKVKELDTRTKVTRGERAIFQAIIDEEGVHWVGHPATSPPRRGASAWGHPGTPSLNNTNTHRVMIKGPAQSWSNEMLSRVITDLDISPEAQQTAQWATTHGAPGTFILLAHPSLEVVTAATRTYNNYLVVEMAPLDAADRIYTNTLVARRQAHHGGGCQR